MIIKKKRYICIVIFFSIFLCLCAFVSGKWVTKQFQKSDNHPSPGSLKLALKAVAIRGFAFDRQMAMGTIDSAKAEIYNGNVEHNLQSVLAQNGMVPKWKFHITLRRKVVIEQGTPEQVEAYRELLTERDFATSDEQLCAINRQIEELLGDIRRYATVHTSSFWDASLLSGED